jgi:hypothetical protein
MGRKPNGWLGWLPAVPILDSKRMKADLATWFVKEDGERVVDEHGRRVGTA